MPLIKVDYDFPMCHMRDSLDFQVARRKTASLEQVCMGTAVRQLGYRENI